MKSRERSGRYMAGGPVVCPDEVVERGSEVCAVGEDIFPVCQYCAFLECSLTIVLSRFIMSNKRSQILPHIPGISASLYIDSVSILFSMTLSMFIYLCASPECSSRSMT